MRALGGPWDILLSGSRVPNYVVLSCNGFLVRLAGEWRKNVLRFLSGIADRMSVKY